MEVTKPTTLSTEPCSSSGSSVKGPPTVVVTFPVLVKNLRNTAAGCQHHPRPMTHPQQCLCTLKAHAALLQCPLWEVTCQICQPVPGRVGAACS